jgi:protein-S-isoprenylcysteine O-methyltransferase Ste14
VIEPSNREPRTANRELRTANREPRTANYEPRSRELASQFKGCVILSAVSSSTARGLRAESVLAFVLMVVGLAWLIARREVFARSPVAAAVQVGAVLLMIAARITFGRRSFHAAASPTAGGLVTSGPYRFWRHPIYAAVLYFVWSAAIDHRSASAITAALLVTMGAAVRMYAEETLLMKAYPDYVIYRARTARVVPFVL